MEGSELGETSGSTRMGGASRVPGPGDCSRNSDEQESQLPSSSRHPGKKARGNPVLNDYGGRQIVQHISSLEHDEVKHKIFISHSRAQKDFAEQLCEDLERHGFLCPFFDQRHHSLPKGKDFAPLIKEAARDCLVAAIVLSEEFLSSKWPMIELAEFHGAQEAGNRRLKMLPLFYKLSAKDLDEGSIKERWMPAWRQLANGDERISVEKWSAAVRALRKVNGIVFGQKGASEAAYRKKIVQSIFTLSPSDLVYGSARKMVGYRRICQKVCDQFVRGTSGGPSFLGLYGTTGIGKTTLCKALCDHFCEEYMGRVCYVDFGDTRRMGRAGHVDLNAKSGLRRVKRMLERLCGLEKEVLDRITDFDEGLMLICTYLKREPVFLVMDNVIDNGTDHNTCREVQQYLMAGLHPESRVVITSRSELNIRGLVPSIQFCMPMPRLNEVEASELFLRSFLREKSIFGLSAEERRIVGLCIQQCLYSCEGDLDILGIDSDDDKVGFLLEGGGCKARGKRYHPVALSALGDFFRRYFSSAQMLRWTEEKKDPLWDLWKSPNGIGRIIGLQFHLLHPSEQLLFLDAAALQNGDGFDGLYHHLHRHNILGYDVNWLCKVHDKTRPEMERRLQDLARSGMIDYDFGDEDEEMIRMNDIYRNYAKWYATNHELKGFKNAWCVFDTLGSTQNQKHVASDLVRLRLFDLDRTSARVFASKMMQELHNLEVLQLVDCKNMTKLELGELRSLKHLELCNLHNLVDVTLSGSGDTSESGGIFESLLFVQLVYLPALVHGPDLRSCTSLYGCHVFKCKNMRNMEELVCPTLKVLTIVSANVEQWARLPSVQILHSLEVFCLERF